MDLHPFVVTKKTIMTCIYALEQGTSTSNCNDCTSWYDCCWMCVPCSFAVDVIICIPMTGICIYNNVKDKCKCKCKSKSKSKKDNGNDVENDGQKDIKNDKTEIKGEKIISSAPTALENPNFYETK